VQPVTCCLHDVLDRCILHRCHLACIGYNRRVPAELVCPAVMGTGLLLGWAVGRGPCLAAFEAEERPSRSTLAALVGALCELPAALLVCHKGTHYSQRWCQQCACHLVCSVLLCGA
jgi:hypothetical protein